MKIKNISNKIIGIGSYTLLPDETQDLPTAIAKGTAVTIYKEARLIEILSAEDKDEGVKDEPAEEPAEEPVEEPKKAKETKKESNADKLARLKDATDEEVAAMAKELGINPATCKTQADVRKKVTKALSA